MVVIQAIRDRLKGLLWQLFIMDIEGAMEDA